MRKSTRRIGVAAMLCGAILLAGWMYAETRTRNTWDRRAAARYLDRREKYWAEWPEAARDQGTFCVSCHTALPYAFARPALRSALAENQAAEQERLLIDNVEKRVRLWSEIKPYYESMPAQSRGTESVLNALILAGRDARNGKLSPDGRAALAHMWEQQLTSGDRKGAWAWILFDNEPWEAADSPYYGACLAAVAAGIAPENYSSDSATQPNIAALSDYLRREAGAQTPIQRLNLLWASVQLPGLLTSSQQQAIVDEILAKQRADGGWSLSELSGGWEREDGTPQVTTSDGYATGFIALVLQQLGYSREDVHVKAALSWLVQNQSLLSGGWSGYSLNKRRHNPFSEVSQFMNDSATAYAVLALTEPASTLRRMK
jgi:squalene-hopene/tetraprenyl-beta-curcumene cyclase